MSELDKFIANVKSDGEKAFSDDKLAPETDEDGLDINKGTVAPESQPEKTEEKPAVTTDVDPNKKADDEVIPFHKHPRWIAKTHEVDDLKSKISALEEFKETVDKQLHEQKTATIQSPSSIQLPEYWVTLWGNSEASKRAYLLQEKENAEREQKIVEETIQRISQRETENKQIVKQEEKKIQDRLQVLRDNGAEFEDEKLLKIVDEFTPKDEHGNYLTDFIPFERAYEHYQLKYPKHVDQPVAQVKPILPRRKVAEIITPKEDGIIAPPTRSRMTSRIKWDSWKDHI